MVGGLVLGIGFGMVGSAVGTPATGLVLGVAGAGLGAAIGGMIDPPCAGVLNCGEKEWERQRELDRKLEPARREMEELQRRLDKLNRMTDAMIEILQQDRIADMTVETVQPKAKP